MSSTLADPGFLDEGYQVIVIMCHSNYQFFKISLSKIGGRAPPAQPPIPFFLGLLVSVFARVVQLNQHPKS